MLTVAQEIVISNFAKLLIARTTDAIKNKPIPRTSVRYENGSRITTNFSAPVNSSGSLIRSLSYEITDTHLIINGNDYAYYLIHGRKPTKNSGSGSVKADILKWMQEKNIHSSEINDSTLAFLIARKIHREGSSVWIRNKGENSGLLTSIVTDEILDEFNAKFTAQLIKELKEEFGN